jgi:O-antigen/teichoic acid export membrane protein
MKDFRSGSVRSRLLRGSGYLFGGSLVSQICSVAQGLLLARYLGVRQYGLLALIIAYPTLINQFLDGRSWEAVVKFVTAFRAAEAPEKAAATVKGVFIADLGTGVLAFALVAISALVASEQLLGGTQWSGLMLLYSTSMILSSPVSVFTGLMRVSERYVWISSVDGVTSLALLLGTVIVVVAGGGLTSIILLMVGIAGAKSLAALALGNSAAKELGIPSFRATRLGVLGADVQPIAKFWLSTNGFAALKGFHQNADTLIVGHFLGPAAVGLYKLARSVANLVAFPVTPFYLTAYPELVKLWHAGSSTRAVHLARRLSFLTAVGVAVVLILFSATADSVIGLVAGEEYLRAVPVLRWLAVGVGISAAVQYYQALLMAAGRLRRVLIAFAVPVLSQMVALLVLVPRIGLLGAGAALLIFGMVRAGMLALWGVRGLAAVQPPPQPVSATA